MHARRVLIVGPSWIGDMVMAQSLFKTLRERDPELEIDVVAPLWSQAVLSRMPEVRQAIEVAVDHGELGFSVRRRVGHSLRGRGYRQAIVLPRSLKSALVPFFARIPIRTGFRGEVRYGLINDMRALDKARLPQTVQRFVALGAPAGDPLPPRTPEPRLRVDEENRQRLLGRLELDHAGSVVALVPGAKYGPSRRWSAERFAVLAGELVREGHQVWVLGSQADRPAAQTILDGCGGRAIDLTGRTDLDDVVDLISLAETVVTNDTGLMHVASAVGTRVVAIYGATTPEATPPLTANKRVVYRGVECSPCSARRCPFGHYRCLAEIEPGEVLDAVREITSSKRAPGHDRG